eukprot:419802_1
MGNQMDNMQSSKNNKWSPLARIRLHSDCYLIPIKLSLFAVVGFAASEPNKWYIYNSILNKWKMSNKYMCGFNMSQLIQTHTSLNQERVSTLQFNITFGGTGEFGIVLLEYKAQNEDQLSVKPGDWVIVLDYNDCLSGWAWVQLQNQQKTDGYVPREYISGFCNLNDAIFIQKKESAKNAKLSRIKCPKPGVFKAIVINYSFLVTFGYLRELKYLKILSLDIIKMIIQKNCIEYIHLMQLKTRSHWRINVRLLTQCPPVFKPPSLPHNAKAFDSNPSAHCM